MMIKQISLFLENSPGKVREPCRVLADAGVNIRTLTLADTQQFGILRLILSDWEKGQRTLQDAGYSVNVTDVVAVEVEDHPGGLAALLDSLAGTSVNIEYMYAFTFGRDSRAVMIFRFDDPQRAIDRLRAAGINVLAAADL
jgi:hypothetical protein